MRLFIVKWVSMDEIHNYYPCQQIFTDYNSARSFRGEMDDELVLQELRTEELFEDKIMSEIYLEEIEI
ncbi:MAG: hypothetical protein NT007_01290 [Candidatus Kapabacteria bacterium]|nr:hypothetical protein [Candidatus Kapabacteria bacterium]